MLTMKLIFSAFLFLQVLTFLLALPAIQSPFYDPEDINHSFDGYEYRAPLIPFEYSTRKPADVIKPGIVAPIQTIAAESDIEDLITNALAKTADAEAELHFQHEELASEHQGRRLGAVTRLKLGDAFDPTAVKASVIQPIVECETNQFDIDLRFSNRPNDRRITTYTEVETGPEYFNQ